MSSKYSSEALDLTLQDLCHNNLPLGGKTIIFSEDWRQVAPVLKIGSEAEIVEHAFMSSHLWSHVKRFRLTQSMRDTDDIPFAKTILAVGKGKIEPVLLNDGSTVVPLKYSLTNEDGSITTCSVAGTTEFEKRIDKVYPDLLEVSHNTYNDRGIFAPTNDSIDHINDYISIRRRKMLDVVSVEYLNSVNVPGPQPQGRSFSFLHRKRKFRQRPR
ncbi:unnamed protein product [Sphacelaria rigidula]